MDSKEGFGEEEGGWVGQEWGYRGSQYEEWGDEDVILVKGTGRRHHGISKFPVGSLFMLYAQLGSKVNVVMCYKIGVFCAMSCPRYAHVIFRYTMCI
jgi:hypothetical protein